ncbi:MAG: HNH endonuclease [Gemmataceae bacterium]|nr:HNH endonuclease [Gemmataceae bacterium]
MAPFVVEHILPLARGGETTLDNLALSCSGCNGYKYAKTSGIDPKTGRRVRLYHPRKQRWQDHFAWTENFTLLVGLTPTGRATVEELDLNRDGLVNLRGSLAERDRHPPHAFREGE